jgi:hypothetical protein
MPFFQSTFNLDQHTWLTSIKLGTVRCLAEPFQLRFTLAQFLVTPTPVPSQISIQDCRDILQILLNLNVRHIEEVLLQENVLFLIHILIMKQQYPFFSICRFCINLRENLPYKRCIQPQSNIDVISCKADSFIRKATKD